MSAAPLDDRIKARAQLEHVARALYAHPTAALRAMRYDAHIEGAEAVSRRLESDFRHYGDPTPDLHGPKGEKVSTYPQLTVRLPVETKARLTTLSLLMATPVWKIIDTAVETFVQHLPDEERKLLGSVADRLARGDWPVTSHWATAWAVPHKSAARAKRARASSARTSSE